MQFTRDPSGTIEVEGETYAWEIRRQPRPVGGAVWEGMAVSLRHVDFKREAIIQFPPPLRPNGRPDVEKQRVNVDAVRNAVTAAIEAGWDPTSRGKAMVFDVDADGR
ncbi:MAG: hypothetical protein O3B22_04565 [Proteobacteria bacterium]|jgi:hypothetical protein|uniref:Uncharacterized protein n=2 Tax=Pseudomonadota TaxID=1224 RepID=A0A7W9C6H2_9CAUL|nr:MULTISPECIES: hypothetical protein [Brevundimonas]MBB1178545.1 hypothetical protein [Pseudomonas sp. FW305-3-2-15-E-TSA4]MDA0218844.1 hypothetical protein [Pseudomonadota bacterium]ALJ08615.1 hypothetical protein JL11_09870 [Brevundimonas sp. DS20]MAL56962.1 hypothetical protein [Brevundimonas sp.]MBB5739532.1 hypothetical protein [Brevundimonas aurantiaca]